MNRTVTNLGPPMAALAAVVWLCWPHIMGAGSDVEEQPAKLPRIDMKRLRYAVPNTLAERANPFAPLPDEQAEPALAGNQPPTERDQRPVDVSSLADELVLNATMVRGDARSAVINNELYRLGDIVPTSLGSDVVLKIAELELDHVLLAAEQGSLRLDYERKAGGRAPAARPPAPASSGRGRKAQGPISTWLQRWIPGAQRSRLAACSTKEATAVVLSSNTMPGRGLDHNQALILRLLDASWDDNPAVEAKLREAQQKGNTIEESLIQAGVAGDKEIAAAYASHYVTPLLDIDSESYTPQPDLNNLLPVKLCRDHLIVPVAASDHEVQVAFFSPDGLLLLDEIKLITGRHVRPLFAPLSTIEKLLVVIFEDGAWTPSAAVSNAEFEEVAADDQDNEDPAEAEEVIHLDQPPPPGRDGRIIRYVNTIFEQALDRGASDIHIEPFEETCRVRLRIDGSLVVTPPPPLSMYAAIVARIKVLAKMDIAEKRIPQDGAIALRTGSRRVDMRVNTCPTSYGEKVVLRVLDKDAIPLRLTSLGMEEQQENDLIESVQMPHGLMLVTGPTGSGKSTTLYSCLNHLNKPDVNICTVEDPVEYKFTGINQVQTKAQVGLNFASALRAFLRQDPDVIMVGEVRDSETAEICLRAALTGHFVLSTLHTNDALSAVSRLGDMGIEPFLLASTLRCVVAQRLIRRLCVECKQEDLPDDETADRLGLPRQQRIFRPRGCHACRDCGYKGRVGVFEVIRITRPLAELIQRRATLGELRECSQQLGYSLLGHNAMAKVCEGLTSLEEALSITVSED